MWIYVAKNKREDFSHTQSYLLSLSVSLRTETPTTYPSLSLLASLPSLLLASCPLWVTMKKKPPSKTDYFNVYSDHPPSPPPLSHCTPSGYRCIHEENIQVRSSHSHLIVNCRKVNFQNPLSKKEISFPSPALSLTRTDENKKLHPSQPGFCIFNEIINETLHRIISGQNICTKNVN